MARVVSTPRLTLLLLTAAIALTDGAVAQEAALWIVHTRAGESRTATLRAAHTALREGRAAPDLANELRALATSATTAIAERLAAAPDSRVEAILTCPPAVVVRAPDAIRRELARRADVVRIEPVRTLAGNLADATGSGNHNVEFVHQVHGLRGAGQTLALVDSGVELRFLGGPAPHPAFLDGAGVSRIVRTWSSHGTALPQLTDQNGHGTGVGAVAIGRRWSNGYAADGFAPAARVASYRVTAGSSLQTTNVDLALAYGQVLLDKIGGQPIGVLNCSFSGSPDPTAIDQRALDELALWGDVVTVTSAGKLSLPPNYDFEPTAASQAATNGIAVGAVEKGTHVVAPFSPFGPLAGDGARVYPDVMAVGQDVRVADRTSNSTVLVSGTSFAAPMVAGTALLLREARPDLDATAIKGLLLATATDLGARNPTLDEQHFGSGLLRSDRAVSAALAGATAFPNGDPDALYVRRGSLADGAATTVRLTLPAAVTVSAALVWPRTDTTAAGSDDLDLDVFAPGNELRARGNLQRNVHERVTFTTTVAGDHDFVITSNRALVDDTNWTLVVVRADGQPSSPAVTDLGGGCLGTSRDIARHLVLPPLPGFGDNRTNKPLTDVPLTFLTAYDAANVSGPRAVSALAFRRARESGASSALGVRLRITLGHTSNPIDGLSANLLSNFLAAPPPVVAYDDWFTLHPAPAVPRTDDFDFVVPLTTPFQLDPALGNVLVHIEVLGNDQNNAPQPIALDAVTVTTGTTRGGLVQAAGSPFALVVEQRPVIAFVDDQPRGRTPRLALSGRPRLGATPTTTLRGAREDALTALLFGSSATVQGQPLPIDLQPFGAAGCAITAAPDELAFVLTDPSGAVTIELPLPNDPQLLALRVRVQCLTLDAAANAPGLTTSNGLELLLGGP